ncbi:MAG: hypothetical protein Q9165_004879 [Trypethelium subeluteriae]
MFQRENRSLLQYTDDPSSSEDTSLQMPEDREKGQPFSHSRYRLWFPSRWFERGRILWIALFLLGLFSTLYFISWLSKDHELLAKLAKLDAFGRYHASLQSTKKPDNFPIVAVVFYGRRQFVDILDCYLQRNLARNGGYLDEVVFAVHTQNEDDIDWLNRVVERTPGYRTTDVRSSNYGQIWEDHLADPGTLYIKLDDDITYIHDDAIPHLVQTLQAHPESYAITANAINSVSGSWIHYHRNAILPYLPEPFSPHHTEEQNGSSWRASELPSYPEEEYPPSDVFNLELDAPRVDHRWLPLRRNGKNIHKTPINSAAQDDFGPSQKKWSIAAQQHYSFLANLEDDRLDRYYFGDESSGELWNLQNKRYSINFVAIWGATVAASNVTADDEMSIAVTNPTNMGRPFFIDSRAIVSHYAYGPQRDELLKTDLLDRYLSLANENACGANNQKTAIPFNAPAPPVKPHPKDDLRKPQR